MCPRTFFYVSNDLFLCVQESVLCVLGSISMCPRICFYVQGSVSLCPGIYFCVQGSVSMCPGTLFLCVQGSVFMCPRTCFHVSKVLFLCVMGEFNIYILPTRALYTYKHLDPEWFIPLTSCRNHSGSVSEANPRWFRCVTYSQLWLKFNNIPPSLLLSSVSSSMKRMYQLSAKNNYVFLV